MDKPQQLEQNMQKYWQAHHSLKLFNDRKKDPLGLDVVLVPCMPLFYNKLIHFFNVLNFKQLLKKVGPVQNKKILDIGCGTGRWCSLLSNLGGEVTGIELSEERVKDNQQRIPTATFLKMSATDLKFDDASFDLVTSVVVIQHIHHDLQKKVANEISRVLKPNGYFLMIEGTKEDESVTYRYSFPRSTRQWTTLFENAGLRLVTTNKMNNFFLILKYAQLRQKIRTMLKKKTTTEEITQEDPYDYKSLLKIQESIINTKQSPTVKILKKIDTALLWAVVKVSYLVEFINHYFIKYYPTSEEGFLFQKR